MRAAQPDRYMDLRRRASGGRCRGRVGGQVWRAVLMGGCKGLGVGQAGVREGGWACKAKWESTK